MKGEIAKMGAEPIKYKDESIIIIGEIGKMSVDQPLDVNQTGYVLYPITMYSRYMVIMQDNLLK